jgi:hydrogenase-4 component F
MNIGFIVNNGVMLWVLVETTTLLVAILVYHERNSLSLEATWKYVFVSTIGLSLALIGIILMNIAIVDAEKTVHFFNNISKNIEITNKILFQIAFILVIIGFSVKMEIFPLHTVCVDANSIAPTPG